MSENVSLLDNLIDKITLDPELLELVGKSSLYFLYQIPRLGVDSYLLQKTTITSSNFFNSFSHKKIKKHQKSRKVLSIEELNNIINYALNISEVHDLLRDISTKKDLLKILFLNDCSQQKTSHETLYRILSLFNEWKYKELNNLRDDRDSFQLILKTALLSIPQFETSIADKIQFKSGEEKNTQFVEDIKKHKEKDKSSLELSKKIFLLCTLIEGYLWELNDNKPQDFCFGNLYDVITNEIIHECSGYKDSKSIKSIIDSNSFYLQNFKFYFYGNMSTDKIKHDKIKEKITELFVNYLSKIIVFSKTIISRMNTDSVLFWHDFSDPLVPLSVAHGLTSVCPPLKIGLFNYNTTKKKLEPEKDKMFNYASSSIGKTSSEIPCPLSRLKTPWGLYQPSDKSLESAFLHLEQDKIPDIAIEKKQILIKTKNVINQDKYIIIEFDTKVEADQYESIKFAFKAFVEKLQHIHRSAILNLSPDLWYKKAFCKLYRNYDEIRSAEHYGPTFRKWEEGKFEEILSPLPHSNAVIYDIGAFYGRLEKEVLLKKFQNKIKVIYAIDQNREYLDEIDSFNNPSIIKTKCCDFRNINLIKKEDADIVCLINTVFGCFKDDDENKSVILKAFDLLKVGGEIIISQFNPLEKPPHCESNDLSPYCFPNEPPKYKCIKTSNHKTPEETGDPNYGRYYGNYMYFDITSDDEKLIKCDAYDIKLYTENWFRTVLHGKSCEILIDDKIDKPNKQILITIKKRNDNKDCYNRKKKESIKMAPKQTTER